MCSPRLHICSLSSNSVEGNALPLNFVQSSVLCLGHTTPSALGGVERKVKKSKHRAGFPSPYGVRTLLNELASGTLVVATLNTYCKAKFSKHHVASCSRYLLLIRSVRACHCERKVGHPLTCHLRVLQLLRASRRVVLEIPFAPQSRKFELDASARTPV